MNIYIQIILFTSIPLLIFYVFYLIKLNTKVEKENIKLSSSLKNKDIEIDSLSNQIKNNNEFSENLKNAVNTITGDIFEKKTKDFKEQNSENIKNILSPLQDEIKRFKNFLASYLYFIEISIFFYTNRYPQIFKNIFSMVSGFFCLYFSKTW